jgi:hypothetical protein
VQPSALILEIVDAPRDVEEMDELESFPALMHSPQDCGHISVTALTIDLTVLDRHLFSASMLTTPPRAHLGDEPFDRQRLLFRRPARQSHLGPRGPSGAIRLCAGSGSD